MNISRLPEDVLVLVFRQCRIHDVLALRLTSKQFQQVLHDYQRAILPSVANATIARDRYWTLYQEAGAEYNLAWLKGLIPRFLSVAVLENPSFRSLKALGWSSIRGDDPLGVKLRDQLENGWKILKRLSNISQKAYSPPVLQLANTFNHQTWSTIESSLQHRLAPGKGKQRQDFTFISQKEDLILARRLEVVKTMSQADAAAYMLVTKLLTKSFRYHPRFDSDGKAVLSTINTVLAKRNGKLHCDYPGRDTQATNTWYTDVLNDTPGPMAPWMLWFVLHTGPANFFKQWTSNYEEECTNVDHVSNLVWSLWDGQDAKTINKRAQLAAQVDLAIRSKCFRPGVEAIVGRNMKKTAIEEAMQRGTSDHKIFVKEALLQQYIMQWWAAGGVNVQWEACEEEQLRDDAMIMRGRHPREQVPFFVYLGREMQTS